MRKALQWVSPVFLVVLATLIPAPFAMAQNGGADIYKTRCIVCHASDGSASSALGKSLKAADLRAPEVQKKSSAELTEFIATGKGNMPPFRPTLSDAEIHSVVAYLRTLKLAKKK